MIMMFSWWWCFYDDDDVLIVRSVYDDDVLIERLEYDDDNVLIKRLEYHDDDSIWELKYDYGADHDVIDQVADRKNKMLKKLLLIEISKYWRCCWLKCWRCCCWSKDPSVEDVADRNV